MVARIEAVERAALEDMFQAAPADLVARLGIEGRAVGTAFVGRAAGLPPSAVVVNRAIGLGMARPAARDEVAEVVALYRQAGVQRYFLHLYPDAQPAEIAEWCAEAGLERARLGQVRPGPRGTARCRHRPRNPPRRAGRRRGGGRHRRRRLRPRTRRRTLDRRPGRPARLAHSRRPRRRPGRRLGRPFRQAPRRLPRLGGDGAGGAGRGCQSALLRARVLDALELGCEIMGTATGEEVPGDPQHSYSNIMRAGFRPEVTRGNFAPPRA